MEFKRKLDFDVKEADYAAEVPPLPIAATVIPAIALSLFIIVPGVMLIFLVRHLLDGGGAILFLPLVFVLLFMTIAGVMFGTMFRGLKRQKMPAVMIKNNTVVAQYRNGWYYIHKSEIKSVTVSETPVEPPETFAAADDSRADVLVSNINAGFTHVRSHGMGSVIPAGAVSFVGNAASFTVSTPSALGAVRQIAKLVVS